MVYWCGQSLPKYLLQFDKTSIRASLWYVGDCQFVFIGLPQPAKADRLFKERLVAALHRPRSWTPRTTASSLPRLTKGQFLGAIGGADVFLDSPEWSGCNSTLESPGQRPADCDSRRTVDARETYQRDPGDDGATETIADTVEGYVEIATRLGMDDDLRKAISAQVAANKSKLYRDQSTIDALADFVVYATRA